MVPVETNAGKFINKEAASPSKRYKESLERPEREREKAIKEKGCETKVILA